MTVKALVIVRAVELDQFLTDELGRDIYVPVMPPSWTCYREDESGWYSVYPGSDPMVFLHAYWLRDSSDDPMMALGQGVFVMVGPVGYLRAIKQLVTHAYTISEIRSGITPVATAIRDAWKDDRTDVGQDVAALRHTICGYDHSATLETTQPGDV